MIACYTDNVSESSKSHHEEDDITAASTSSSSFILPVPTRLTTAGEIPGVSCGLADFLAQEEMDRYVCVYTCYMYSYVRLDMNINRYEGYWWSPDSSRIVFAGECICMYACMYMYG